MKTGIYWQDPKYALGRWPTGPSTVLYLPLHKLDGASFMSKDAYGHLCTVNGALCTPKGRDLDGADDYIDMPKTPILRPTGDLLIHAWINPRSYTGAWIFVVTPRTLTYRGIRLSLDASGYIELRVGNGSSFTTVTGGTAVPLDEWSMITGMRSGNEISVWLNADKDPTTGTLTGDISYEPTWSIRIGEWFEGSNDDFDGVMGEFLFNSRALTSLEIQHFYLATKWRYQ